MAVPKYLFRCSSDQSNGLNTPTLFAPASLADHYATQTSLEGDNSNPASVQKTSSEQLYQALLWKKDLVMCPFVFFTSSPLFAVQLSVWRATRKVAKDRTVIEPDNNITISIIDTHTAKTSEGQSVQFQKVSDLMNHHGIEIRNKSDRSIRKYEDHWVITTSLVPGGGSHYATFQCLADNGLYELYPELQAANDRKDPRPSLTTGDLRKYNFGNDASRLLTREKLDTAARLALCFKSSSETLQPNIGDTVGTVVAFMLSLQKRHIHDLALKFWLRDHAEDKVNAFSSNDDVIEVRLPSGLPDAVEFENLEDLFSGKKFFVEDFAFGLAIEPGTVEKEKSAWNLWWRQNRNEYREERGQRREGRKTKGRYFQYGEDGQRQRQDSVVGEDVTGNPRASRISGYHRPVGDGRAPSRRQELAEDMYGDSGPRERHIKQKKFKKRKDADGVSDAMRY